MPSLELRSDSALDTSAEVLVMGVAKSPTGPRLFAPTEDFAALEASLTAIGVSGANDELRRLPALRPGTPSLALVGLGTLPEGAEEPTVDTLRNAAGSAIRQLAGTGSVAFALPGAASEQIGAVLEGAAIASYSFTGYRFSTLENAKQPVAAITVLVESLPDDADALTARALAVAGGVHRVRDLVHTPPNDLYPASFVDRARGYAKGLPVDIEELDEQALAEGGFGGILGVGQGSSRPPRLAIVRYAPAGATKHLALVGKGITFDSGGLSLKPAGSMVGMKYDMTGAATALAAILAVAELGLPVRVTAWLCLAENMPSGTAIRPNDVLRIRGGKTVEVLNTDAEGRLVLADGLVAASEEQPDAIIDVATLTGAARVAMGERTIPVMGDTELSRALVDAGARAGETLWPMPLPSELSSLLETEVADIANAKPGNTAGGMLLAGVFLKSFVGTREGSPIPWAHLDIAGAASNGGAPYGVIAKGPTGATVRTLIAMTEDFSRP